MEFDSQTARLCIAGTQAEFARDLDAARQLFRDAWDAALDDCDAAMAAHYVAHLESDPAEALRWNLVALERGRRDPRAQAFMGSLYVSLGGSYETLGRRREAERCFALASECGVEHHRGDAG